MNVCVICTDVFNTIDTIITKCNHKFHFACLNKWLLIKPQCPYCREDIHDLINPRTNEKIVYLDEQDESDENYEQGEQYIIIPNVSIIFPVYNSIFLTYIFTTLTHVIYFYDSCLTLNYNSFIILVILYLNITLYLYIVYVSPLKN